MALGSPLALQRSLSFGVVSSKDRYLSDDFKLPTGEKTGSFNTWIQTDAAINPGNSGGPLVNLKGEVVGVNSRGAFGASSIGFAIPINIVKEVAAELIANGPGPSQLARHDVSASRGARAVFRSAEEVPGAVIRSVEPDSPAARAGIEAGDVLVSYAGERVAARFSEELPGIYKKIADTPVGEEVEPRRFPRWERARALGRHRGAGRVDVRRDGVRAAGDSPRAASPASSLPSST